MELVPVLNLFVDLAHDLLAVPDLNIWLRMVMLVKDLLGGFGGNELGLSRNPAGSDNLESPNGRLGRGIYRVGGVGLTAIFLKGAIRECLGE